MYDFYARGTVEEQEQERNYSKFIDQITDDVLMCVKKLRTIEGDINQTITIADLPAGDYDVVVEYFGDNVFFTILLYTI